MRYRINQPAVVSEVFDGEAIIINLDTGNYYSLLGTATYVWEALAAGHDAPTIGTVLSASTNGAMDAPTDVSAFVTMLLAEGLIVTDTPAEPTELLKPVSAVYAPPQLHKFTDMQYLLLLDPIHQVDEEGWPRAPRQD